MFSKKLRVMALLLVFALIGVMAAGCGSQKADKAEEETKTEAADSSKQEDKDASTDQSGKAETGEEKTVKVIVTHKDESKKEFEYTTKLEMLGDLLTEEKLVEGTEGEMGLYITAVDGEQADDKNQEWWKIEQNGEMTQTGADTTKMSDGDTFDLIFTTGYY